jgi:hypothetical protein
MGVVFQAETGNEIDRWYIVLANALAVADGNGLDAAHPDTSREDGGCAGVRADAFLTGENSATMCLLRKISVFSLLSKGNWCKNRCRRAGFALISLRWPRQYATIDSENTWQHGIEAIAAFIHFSLTRGRRYEHHS